MNPEDETPSIPALVCAYKFTTGYLMMVATLMLSIS